MTTANLFKSSGGDAGSTSSDSGMRINSPAVTLSLIFLALAVIGAIFLNNLGILTHQLARR